MSNVDINILSRHFNIACPEEKHDALRSAANMLDSELKNLRSAMSSDVEFEKLVVTAALNYCARYERLVNEFEEQMTIIMDTNNALSSRLAASPEPVVLTATSAVAATVAASAAPVVPESGSAPESEEPSAASLAEIADAPLQGFDAGDEDETENEESPDLSVFDEE